MRSQRSGIEDLFTKRVTVDGVTQRVPSKRAERGGLRWRARFVDDEGREVTKAFGRKVDAQAWIDEQTAARITGTYVDPRSGKVTFASYYKEWSSDQVWVPGTRRAMDLAANSVTFGDVAFGDLKPSHVQAWVKAMQDKPLAASTIRTRFNNVRGVIRSAVADRVIGFDVTLTVKIPRVGKREKADDDGLIIPEAGEVGALLSEAEDKFAAFIGLCAFAGLRLGEAAALKVSDIDFMRKQIRVDRQVQRANGGQVEIRPPKYGSNRTVYVPDGLINLLSEHVRVHVPGDNPDRWMFPGKGEHPLHQNSVGYLWRKARRKAGVSVETRLHDLRHFYASGLIYAGCDPVTVQRAMGHKSATVTLNTYSHKWPKAEDRTRNAATAMFAEAVPAAAYPLRTAGS